MKALTVFLLSVPLIVPGCAGLAVGAGATAGIAAAREGGISSAVNDTVIRATINDLWFKYDLETFAKLNLTVDRGRVLITGVVQNAEHRVEAVRLAWQAEGVREVINEAKVANSGGITGYARDTWITGRLRAAMTFDRNIQSINYTIDTVQGVVYLMGLAQNQTELNRVIEVARTIPDVKQVVSYVKLVGQPLPKPVGAAPGNARTGFADDPVYPDNGPSANMGDGTSSASVPVPLVPAPVQQETLDSGSASAPLTSPGYGGGF